MGNEMAIERESILDNRTIRVFISSTFQDMQDERSELIRKTFPRLRDLAARRDVTLTEVDLRWGITKEESESGKVMEICLREVKNSIPFFIGIIGNRYGWIPGQQDISEIVKERFPKVPDYVERHLSATEIEMQFGVLDRTDVDMNAYFFIKEEEASDVDDPERLAALKKAVRENKKYPVSTYTTPEDLADQVLAAFTKLLDDLFPVGELSALEKERLGQRVILNNLSRVYIKTESNFAVIDKWMEDWEKHQLVITGASGLGKSALVANWVKEKLKLGEKPPYRIIYHFVGYGGSIGSDWHVIKALCDEIRDRYGFRAEENEPKTDEKVLYDLFNRVAVEGDKPLLIVLDGINQILDVNYAKRLNWLPVPSGKVKILFTTLEDDGTMEVFKDRQYPIFTLKPLTRDERIDMVREYLDKTYRKHLEDPQLERIVDDPQNVNTLVLKTLLDEVANYGVYEKLDEKIEEYLKPDSIGDFYQVVLQNYEADFGEELVRHFLSLIAVSRNGISEDEILDITDTKDKPLLWSQFYCSFRQHLIVKNGLVSFAHAYIREAVEARYVNVHEDWVKTCREEIVTALENQKTSDGRHHSESIYQLLQLNDSERLYRTLLNPYYFLTLYKEEEALLIESWKYLIKCGHSIHDYSHLEEEYNNLGKLYLSISRFCDKDLALYEEALYFGNRCLDLMDDGDHDLLQKALLTIASIYQEQGKYEECIETLMRAKEVTSDIEMQIAISNNLGNAYMLNGKMDLALKFYTLSLEQDKKTNSDISSGIATSYNNIGNLYRVCGEYDQAIHYLTQSLEISRIVFGKDSLEYASSCNSLATTFLEIGEYAKAIDYFESAKDVYYRFYGEDHTDTALILNNLGYAMSENGENEKGLPLVEKSLEIRLRLLGNIHPDVAASMHNIGIIYRRLGYFDKAILYLQESLDIKTKLFGENHPDVSGSYNEIGLIHYDDNNYEEAIKNYKKAIKILSDSIGANHIHVGITYGNIGAAYKRMENYKDALSYYLKALSIYTHSYGKESIKLEPLLYNIGKMYYMLEDYDNAVVFMKKDLELCLLNRGENDMDVLYAWRALSAAYNKMGQFQNEKDCLRHIIEIGRLILDENNNGLQRAIKRYNEIK
jgi:Tfp pilus assembly protein PilF